MKSRPRPMNGNVYWALPAHDRPEGPGEHSGAIPECARAIRRQPGRGAPGSVPQRVPVRGVGARRRRAQRTVAVRRASASCRPPLDLARAGSRTRWRGTLLLPPDSRQQAGLAKDVTLVGLGREFFEIWDRKRFEEYERAKRDELGGDFAWLSQVGVKSK